jgi:tubulin monoglycylase TTLL3/8
VEDYNPPKIWFYG